MYSICKNIATIHNYKKYDEKEFKKSSLNYLLRKIKIKQIHVYYSRICCLIENMAQIQSKIV